MTITESHTTESLTIDQALQQAIALHQAGNLQGAEQLYRAIIKAEPKHPDANHNLRALVTQVNQEIEKLMILFNKGSNAETERLARKMTELFPGYGFGWKVLGTVLKLQGLTLESLAPMQKAAELSPRDSEAHHNLGLTLKALGRLDEAESCCRRSLEIKPDLAEAHYSLANILKALDRSEEAEGCYRRALEFKPNHAGAHNNLGAALYDLRRLDEAEASYRRVLEIKPDYASAYSNLGNTLVRLGRLAEAETSCRRAVQITPDFAEAHCNLGNTLKELGRFEEAEASCRRAIQIEPDFAEAHISLGNILNDMLRFEEAEASFSRALELKPDLAKAHCNLGNTLKDVGRQEEAEASYRRALAIKPDFAEAYDNLLFALNYAAGHSATYCLEEAKNYGQMVARKVGERFSAWDCVPQPECLRVGLVSGDLSNHPVGYFLESVLAQIDLTRIELIAYPTDYKADALTARIKPYFSAWKSLAGLNDEAAARLIHANDVHVLLDLSGHTAKNRLPIFAWKPAPVQATWLGYLATTGVAEMDYLLGDPQATPPEDDGHFSEKVWRLPDVWACFTPPDAKLEVGPLPALSTGCITFGCFNNLTKMNDAVVALWARVLKAVPGSRLFLKTKQLEDPTVGEATRRRFAEQGIEPGRLILEGASPRAELLAAYNRVDIALDPFPYGGGTTTFEVLWMAVPVITRRGDRFLSRCGQSLAYAAGLADWIAEGDDDYVAKTVAHTQDLKQLAALRDGLRRQVLTSSLFDASRFARHLEAALWGMWEIWCEQNNRDGRR